MGKESNESPIEDTQLALPRRVRIWVRTYLLEKALLLEFMKRSNRRLDYKILHETGEKVYLENTSMSTSVSLDGRSITGEYEAKVICKIETFLEENDLTLFFDLEEVKNAIERARNILQEFEDVHVELKNELGSEEYPKRYTHYTHVRSTMMSWIKNARLASNEFKKQFSEQKSEGLKAEERFLYKRITVEIENLEAENPLLLQDHERQLSVAEQLISEYTDLFRKIEQEGPEFSQGYGEKYENTYRELKKVITNKRSVIQNFKLSQEAEERNRQEMEASLKACREKDEIVLSCKSIYVNLCDRFSSLETKLKVQMFGLTDAQVLEKKAESKMLEKEYHDILDKILKLSQSNLGRYDDTTDLVMRVNQRKGNLKNSLDDFRDRILWEILDRDLSGEKVKYASLLGINLPKFGDCKSDIDFYSFKCKFL